MQAQTNTDWISTEEKVLTMSDHQLHSDIPAIMRVHGFTEDEIKRAIQIVVEFRDQHKMPIID